MRALICALYLSVIATASAGAPPKDFTIQLDRITQVTLAGYTFTLAVHDDGPKAIRVSFNREQPVMFWKRDGFDQDQIETELYTHGTSKLYYVNTISDKLGFCVLRIRSE
jgi:hypothetical protein